MAKSLGNELFEQIDDLISEHVISNANDVEGGWELRGFMDGLAGSKDTDAAYDPNYGNDYRRGFKAGRAFRN
jgi:hypothetical protein